MDDDESTTSAAASTPGGDSPTGEPGASPAPRTQRPTDEPPGIRAQVGSTFAAGKRLLAAHIDLAKAEAADIAGAVGRMVGLDHHDIERLKCLPRRIVAVVESYIRRRKR